MLNPALAIQAFSCLNAPERIATEDVKMARDEEERVATAQILAAKPAEAVSNRTIYTKAATKADSRAPQHLSLPATLAPEDRRL